MDFCITCSNLACGVHSSVVPISSYKRNNGRRRFKRGFRNGFPLCLEVFVVWEITPTQRSFPISTVAALVGKHISCSYRSTCSTKRTTERLSTHRRSLHVVDRQRSHVETKWDSFDLSNLFQYALQIRGRHNVLIHKPNVYLPSSSCWCLEQLRCNPGRENYAVRTYSAMSPPPVSITNYCWWVDSFSATARSTAAMTGRQSSVTSSRKVLQITDKIKI